MFVKTTQKLLTSVGVDIGSSTSHIIFSSILLEKDPQSRSEKFKIKERKILHSGTIHLTPFIDADTINLAALRNLFLRDYVAAGIEVSEVDTGAVIITGETAKKQNAEQIVKALAGETGKFVAATAGPNFEAVLAAYGAGAVSRSENTGHTIMNADVGGGSSNISICQEGRIVQTAAINVGGRLLATDDRGILIRLEETGRKVAEQLGIELSIGQTIDVDILRGLASSLAESLVDALQGPPESDMARMLMMTPPLDVTEKIDELTFSGGVAEYIYETENREFNDLGRSLADAIRVKVTERGLPLREPEHKIRATVIGAGQSSLQVSGSTTFLSAGLDYPLRNLPVVVPHIPRGKQTSKEIRRAIMKALERFDIQEGLDPLILAFKDAVRPSYENLTSFSQGVVAALPTTIRTGKSILMCFDTDIGNSVGNVMKREIGIENEILSIDEIALDEGDYVDIGEPIIEGAVVPVVVKTLVFNKE
ncbi:MAG: ethanolamine ammonia-lyase reactivating factor EutA [Candidatus Thorarchaeota archaeon]|nr:ethanolamine ammonia-lyase reactivating factor EutA [Candidatus Thorarchaeota archaeon]